MSSFEDLDNQSGLNVDKLDINRTILGKLIKYIFLTQIYFCIPEQMSQTVF